MSRIVCTAWNKAFAGVGELCLSTIQSHCARNAIPYKASIIPDDYPRPASWFKIDLILECLKEHGQVLWLDADCLLIDPGNIARDAEKYIQPLSIAFDENGANGGVMLWRKSHHSIRLLETIRDSYNPKDDGPWWEQHHIHRLMQQTPIHDQWWEVLPKWRWNAYTNELCPETRILHYAGFEIPDKITLMKAQLLAIARNGHGPRP